MDSEVDLLGERIAEQAAHLDAATHRLLADLREFDARGGWHTQGAMSCAHWLSWRVGWDLVTARERVRVAQKLGEFPATDDALRRGELSYSKVRAIVRVVTPVNEAMLIECARLSTASQLERVSRKYAHVQAHCKDPSPRDDEQRRYVRRRDTYDGMVKIEAVLHPEEAEVVWAMLDHSAKQLAHTLLLPPTRDDCTEAHAATTGVGTRSASVCATTDAAESLAVSGATTGSGARSASVCVTADAAESLTVSESLAVSEATTGFGARSASVCVTTDAAESLAASGATNGSGARSASVSVTTDAAESLAASGATTGAGTRSTSVCVATDAAESLAVPETTTGAGTRSASVCVTTDAAESLGIESAELGDAGAQLVEQPGSANASYDTSTRTAPPPARPLSVLHQAADAAKRAFNRADALLAIAQAYLRGDRPNRAPIDVMVTIPLSDLREGASDPADVACMGSSCIAAETARRLSCDAGVIEVVEDEHGVPLSVGRKRRTIAGSIKRALLKRDTMCTYPGCENRIFLEGHHVRHWADGGETSLMNVTLLCTHHHHFVHEYGYRIELGADQRPQFRDPGGRLVTTVPLRPTPPDLGWPRIRAANEGLAINAETIACEWDGTRMPYATVIDHLVGVDGLT